MSVAPALVREDGTVSTPPNWRTVVEPTPVRPGVYRSAAPFLGEPAEIAACPAELTWLDLRSAAEADRDGWRAPTGWHRASVDLDPRAQVDKGAANAVLRDIREGRTTFGDLYRRILADHPDRVVGAFRALAASDGPVLVACLAGRDRTGVVVALLRELLGHPREEVVADYLATTDDLPRFLARLTERLGDGVDIDLTCHRADVEAALAVVDAAGGARAWLLAAGVPEEDLATIQARWG